MNAEAVFDRLAEFCAEPRVGLQILLMALPARRIPTILCAALFKKNNAAGPRIISSSELALVCCMRLSIAWLLPKDWLAAPFRRRFHCAAHMFCTPPLVGLHSFHPVAERR